MRSRTIRAGDKGREHGAEEVRVEDRADRKAGKEGEMSAGAFVGNAIATGCIRYIRLWSPERFAEYEKKTDEGLSRL